MTRPVYPVPFNDALRGAPTLFATGIQPITDLSMSCLVRAYYGGYFRAAWAIFCRGMHWQWIKVRVFFGGGDR